MPRNLHGLLLTAAALLGLGPSDTVGAQSFARRVYLLAGQSNMAGRGAVAERDQQIHPRVFALDRNDRWQPAVDPLHFDKKIAGVGPGLQFGRVLAESLPDVEIGLVPCAVGGSAIAEWQPGATAKTGSHPLDDLLGRAKVAAEWGPIAGVIWHQGESDRDTDPEVYRERLSGLVARVREAVGDPELPWVVGTLGRFRDGVSDPIHALLCDLPNHVTNLGCVRAAGLSHKGDRTHFDAASAREYGRRYALALIDLQRGLAPAPGHPSSRPLWPGTPPIAARVDFEPAPPDPEGRLGKIRDPDLTVHLPDAAKHNGAAVLVCPGGGYSIVAAGHEGEEVATWLNSLGFTAVVLRYRLKEYGHPAPMLDGQRALRWLRSRAGVYGLDTTRIGVLGFSAGGHLAATLSTHFDDGDPDARDPVDRTSCRPDFAVLVYPVISMTADFASPGSRRNLLGDDPAERWRRYYSAELQVSARTPPTFLVHSRDDPGVKIDNSRVYRDALRRVGVPVELVEYETGGHGYGLGREGSDSAAWPARCGKWLAGR